MALAIGFTNKYYTLWDVSSEKNYSTVNGTHYLASVTYQNNYHQNLSMDLDKAIEKAKEMGVTSLEVQSDLRGVSRSFSDTKPCDAPEATVTQFQYGKEKYNEIGESSDLDYLLWYSNDNCNSSEAHNRVISTRVCELDSSYITLGNGVLTTKIGNARMNLMTSGRVFTSGSNFSTCQEQLEEHGTASIRVFFKAETKIEEDLVEANLWGVLLQGIDVSELNLQRRCYQGNEYFVPKGMRSFKNTEFKIVDNKIVIV